MCFEYEGVYREMECFSVSGFRFTLSNFSQVLLGNFEIHLNMEAISWSTVINTVNLFIAKF